LTEQPGIANANPGYGCYPLLLLNATPFIKNSVKRNPWLLSVAEMPTTFEIKQY
jgi:hypothetical protein